jgi:hypothetical protein
MPEQHETAREFSAVPVVWSCAILAAVAGGIWFGPWAAIVVTVGFALSDRGADRVVIDRERLGEPPQVIDRGRALPDPGGGGRATRDASFAEELRTHAGGRPLSIFIMAPALSPGGTLAGDQKGYEDATRRLNEIVEGSSGPTWRLKASRPSDPLSSRRWTATVRRQRDRVCHDTRRARELAREGVVTTAESRYFQAGQAIMVAGG